MISRIKRPDLSIIIVLYRSEESIGPLLDSIQKSPDKLTKEILIIDNAYPDKALQIAKDHPLKPKTFSMGSNAGLSKAVNFALKYARGKFILLLNPDMRVLGNALGKLHAFAANQIKLGAVAPRLVFPDGKPQASVFRLPTITGAIRHYFFGCHECFNKYLPKAVTQPVEVAIMAAFLIPRSTINQVGGLDERFFLYYEDVEFCRRLKKAGLPVIYLPSAKIEHVHGASGRFTSHLASPLAKSAEIYYGRAYSFLLNCVLWFGQKWQKLAKLIR